MKKYFVKKILAFVSFYNRQKYLPSFWGIFLNPMYIVRKRLADEIRKLAPQLSGDLLDFGCGSKPYKNLFHVNSYTGVDIEVSGHPHHLEQIDKYYDGHTIPFPDSFFDSLLCTEVLEHVINIDEILNELNRVLKKNSLAIITIPFVWDEHEAPYDFRRLSSYGIKAILSSHGFEIAEQKKTSNFVESLWQLWCVRLHYFFSSKNFYLNILLNIIFISPFMIAGIFFGKVFSGNKNLFLNNVILAKKI